MTQRSPVQHLLDNARNLAGAAEFLKSGRSTFGKWCIPGLLPQQGTAAIYGPTMTGKTFVALHLALSIAGAVDWFGKRLQAAKPRGDDAIKQAVSYAKKTLFDKKYIEIDAETSVVRICQNA